MTPYEAIYSKAHGLAELTNDSPETATIFIKIVQAIYLYLNRTKTDPARMKVDFGSNSHGLVLTVNATGRGDYTLDIYHKRFNDYGRIIKALNGLTSLFISVYKYCREHQNLKAILSASGNKIVISGVKKEFAL